MFLNNDSRLFVNALVNFGYAFSSSLSMPDRTDLLNLKIKDHQSVSLGVGYSFNKYSIELRYNFPKELLSDYNYWTSNLSGFSLIMGYRLIH